MRKLIASGFVVILGTGLVLAPARSSGGQDPGIDTTGQRVTKYPKVDTTARKTPQYNKIDTSGKKTPVPIKINAQPKKTPGKTGIDTTQKVQPNQAPGISTKDIQTDKNFELREVKFSRLNKDVISVTGKLTNKSGRSYSKSATFDFLIFDTQNNLVGSGTIKVSGLSHNSTVNFQGKIYSRAEPSLITKYKIHFVKGS